MRLYLDASALVPLCVDDRHSASAEDLVTSADDVVVSEWTLAESTSALNRLRRMGSLDSRAWMAGTVALDAWSRSRGRVWSVAAEDVTQARQLLERTATALRTPDALHLAIVRRIGAQLATFDGTLADAARETDVAVHGA